MPFDGVMGKLPVRSFPSCCDAGAPAQFQKSPDSLTLPSISEFADITALGCLTALAFATLYYFTRKPEDIADNTATSLHPSFMGLL
jgi:hypothetical protein